MSADCWSAASGSTTPTCPGGCPATPFADVEAAFASAGLEPLARFSTWDRAPFDEQRSGYVVTVDRLS